MRHRRPHAREECGRFEARSPLIDAESISRAVSAGHTRSVESLRGKYCTRSLIHVTRMREREDERELERGVKGEKEKKQQTVSLVIVTTRS